MNATFIIHRYPTSRYNRRATFAERGMVWKLAATGARIRLRAGLVYADLQHVDLGRAR